MPSTRQLRSPPKRRGNGYGNEIEMPNRSSNKIYEPPSIRIGMKGRDPNEDYQPFSPTTVPPSPGMAAPASFSKPSVNTKAEKATRRRSATTLRSPRKAYSPVSRAPRIKSSSPTRAAAKRVKAVEQQQMRPQRNNPVQQIRTNSRSKSSSATVEKRENVRSRQNVSKAVSSIKKTLQREAKMMRRPLGEELLQEYCDDSSDNDERYHPKNRSFKTSDSEAEARDDGEYYDGEYYDGTTTDYNSATDSYESYTEVEVTSSLESDQYYKAMEGDYQDPPSPVDKYKNRLQKWYRNRLPILSKSFSQSTMSSVRGASTNETDDEDDDDADTVAKSSGAGFAFVGSQDENEIDGGVPKKRQQVAFCTIGLTSIQLLVLMLQLAMCGVAPFDINPMGGPFPDAFSLWGGKNPYKMLEEDEWWRMITPAFLHVGILHLAANVFCQLNAVALFEREWGWFTWILIYIISTVGCSAFSNYFDQDTVAVGSSGSLMGLFAAKLAQVVTLSIFETRGVDIDDVIQLDQLSSVLCGLTLLSLLGSFTYIDWSGNMGGLLSGFLAGIFIFSSSIDGCCWSFLWFLLGLLSLVSSIGYVMYLYVEEASPEEELTDVCNYFRSLWTENYECGCMWD